MPAGFLAYLLQLAGVVMGFLAARGLDAIAGKWLATLSIAFENAATASAMAEYNRTRHELSAQISGKAQAWEAWRNKTALTLSSKP